MMGKKLSIEQLLRCAVLASWKELMPANTPALVRIDYHPGGDAPLQFVKIWASTERGYWRLVCDYWPEPLWLRPRGLTFSNGYHADRLLQVFEVISQNPQSFTNTGAIDRDGGLLLQDVTPQQCAQAEHILAEALLPVAGVIPTSGSPERIYAKI